MTLDEQIKAVGREVGLRRAVYPRFVAQKKLTQAEADHQLAAMEEVYKTLKRLRDKPTASDISTPEGHQARHVELHQALDELFADFITHHPGRTGWLDTTYRELMTWSHEQTISPTEAAVSISTASTEQAKKDAALNPAASWPFPKGPMP